MQKLYAKLPVEGEYVKSQLEHVTWYMWDDRQWADVLGALKGYAAWGKEFVSRGPPIV